MLRPLFFFLSFLETLGLLLDFLLFLSSHPVIGASGTSRQRVSTLRDAGVASLSPSLPLGETEQLLSAVRVPAEPRGNVPVPFIPIVSYDFVKCLRCGILAVKEPFSPHIFLPPMGLFQHVVSLNSPQHSL